ncbi:MAG: hypothetical protein ACLT38_06895 [Akkermansia sp.]
MSESNFKNSSQELIHWVTFPLLDEYNPGITADMWATALDDATVTYPENLDMFRKIMELGGESTCAHLAEVYGKTPSYYNAWGTQFSRRVKKKYSCPNWINREDGTERWKNERWKNWCIPFVGRYVVENGKERFLLEIGDELKEALMNMDITMGSLKENPVTDVGLNTIFTALRGQENLSHGYLRRCNH